MLVQRCGTTQEPDEEETAELDELIEEHVFERRIGMSFTVTMVGEVVVIDVDPQGDAAAYGVRDGR